MSERHSFAYKIQRALAHPRKIVPYIHKLLRTRRLSKRTSDFLEFYAAVVDDDAVHVSPNRAIGSDSEESWATVGRLQFEYLLKHGLQANHRVLDIGCGNLRLGTHLIRFLDANNYVGLDISPKVMADALKKVGAGLADKTPRLYLLETTNYDFLPAEYFDRVQAHSVFSHLPLGEIEKVLRHAHRAMKPGATFDFTYFEAAHGQGHFLNIDFYHPRSQLLDLCANCGFTASQMDDWDYPQAKIRAVRIG